jgi:hypothetical protein
MPKLYIFIFLFFTVSLLQAQTQGQLKNEVLENKKSSDSRNRRFDSESTTPTNIQPNNVVDPTKKTNVKLVYLEKSETLSYDEHRLPGIQILNGNVRFRHDDALMYCDSAYFYENVNSIDAFGNVRIEQGDTLFIYGDKLYYDGNARFARLRQNVRMINRSATLTTDSLNYDRNTDLAYYYTGGQIVDSTNVLTSVWGQYSSNSNDALFSNSVKLVNPNFVLNSDTLIYNTTTHIANIVGTTHILYNDETDIYSNKGWYNTDNEQMMLLNRSIVAHKDGKSLTGDTVYYDKSKKYGESFINVEITDSINKSTIYGDYAFYDEVEEISLVTDSALLVDWSSVDTLWVHADTLRTFKDSIYDVAIGYYNVRIFRNDIQGVCDSLAYTARDSIMNMYGEPVIWAEQNQLSGEFIQAFIKDNEIEHIHIQRNAIAVQQEDSVFYNQMAGKEIIAYIKDGELYRVNVNGNAETIYFPRDEADSSFIGINKTESSYVIMYFEDKKIQRIVTTAATTGVMYPIDQLSGGDLYLKNFFWLKNERPESSDAVMIHVEREKREKIGTSSLTNKGTP